VSEAAYVLEQEITIRKEMNLIELTQEYEKKEKRNNRLLLIQTLANTVKTGTYDTDTVTMLENNLMMEGVDYHTKKHGVDEEAVDALIER